MAETLNIVSGSEDWRAQILNNFAPFRFWMDGQEIASVEGFVIGIKFPPGDPRREQTFAMSGFEAKRMTHKARKAYGRQWVWLTDGRKVSYGGPEHRLAIKVAIGCKVLCNPKVQEALVATAGLELAHDLGHPESPTTSLPASEFVKILTDLRKFLTSK